MVVKRGSTVYAYVHVRMYLKLILYSIQCLAEIHGSFKRVFTEKMTLNLYCHSLTCAKYEANKLLRTYTRTYVRTCI